MENNDWEVIDSTNNKKIGMAKEKKNIIADEYNVSGKADNKAEHKLDIQHSNVNIKGNTKELKFHMDFEKMGLKEPLLRGLWSYGFEKPSLVNVYSFPIITGGSDIVVQSGAGSGKTGAFVLGILQNINENERQHQALIITPTRELCFQIGLVVNELGKYMNVKSVLCIGGIRMEENIRDLSDAQIIIGSLGRITALIDEKYINIRKIKMCVLDEVDELLNRKRSESDFASSKKKNESDFFDSIKKIILQLSNACQICAFSATLPMEILDLTNNFMNDPVNLHIEKEKLSIDKILQYKIDMIQPFSKKDKLDKDNLKFQTLEDLYSRLSIGHCMIYVNSIETAEWLRERMDEKSYDVMVIHSKLTHNERSDIMKKFRSGECRVLISTDLLSRGIDVQQVGYVINYDIPYKSDNYLHRIGRSGRYNKKGVAINFVASDEHKRYLEEIEKHHGTIGNMPDPEYLEAYLKE